MEPSDLDLHGAPISKSSEIHQINNICSTWLPYKYTLYNKSLEPIIVTPDDFHGAPVPSVQNFTKLTACVLLHSSIDTSRLITPLDQSLCRQTIQCQSPQNFTKLTGYALLNSYINTCYIINQLDQSLCHQTTSTSKGLQYQSLQIFTKLTGYALLDSCIDANYVINQLYQSVSPDNFESLGTPKIPQRPVSDFQYQIGTQIFPGIRVGKGDLNRQ